MKFTTVTKVLEKHTDELRHLNHVIALKWSPKFGQCSKAKFETREDRFP